MCFQTACFKYPKMEKKSTFSPPLKKMISESPPLKFKNSNPPPRKKPVPTYDQVYLFWEAFQSQNYQKLPIEIFYQYFSLSIQNKTEKIQSKTARQVCERIFKTLSTFVWIGNRPSQVSLWMEFENWFIS